MPRDVDGIPERTPEDFRKEQEARLAEIARLASGTVPSDLNKVQAKHEKAHQLTQERKERQREYNRRYRERNGPARSRRNRWYVRISDNKPFESIRAVQAEHSKYNYDHVRTKIMRGLPIDNETYRPATDDEATKFRVDSWAKQYQTDKPVPPVVPQPETTAKLVELTDTPTQTISEQLTAITTQPGRLRVIYIEGTGPDVSQLVRQILST